jgi:hypothetical protein
MVGNGIKIIYESQTKRINEKVENFNTLKEKIKNVFNLKNQCFSLMTEKNIPIKNDQDMSELFKMSQNLVPKIIVRINNESPINYLSDFCDNHIRYSESIFKSDIFDNFSFIEFNKDNEKINETTAQNFKSKKDLQKIVNIFVNDILERANAKTCKIMNKLDIAPDLESKNLNNQLIFQSTSDSFSLRNAQNIKEKIDPIVASKLSHIENKHYKKIFEIVGCQNFTISHNLIEQIESEIISTKIIQEQNTNFEKFPSDDAQGNTENKMYQTMNLVRFNEKCCICSQEICGIKYSCLICLNMISCQYCQTMHLHPMLSVKSTESTEPFSFEDFSNFMLQKMTEKKNKENNRGFFRKISENFFEKKTKPKIYVYSNIFSVRANKKFKIPIILCNENEHDYPSNSLIVLTRGNLDLQISQLFINSEISSRSEFNLDCQSSNRLRSYDYEIILYSKKEKAELEVVNMKIDVNEDQDEDLINDYFAMYSKILAIPKKEKEMIMYINKKQICLRHPYIIYNIMTQHNWNLDEALDDLTFDDEINSQPVKI